MSYIATDSHDPSFVINDDAKGVGTTPTTDFYEWVTYPTQAAAEVAFREAYPGIEPEVKVFRKLAECGHCHQAHEEDDLFPAEWCGQVCQTCKEKEFPHAVYNGSGNLYQMGEVPSGFLQVIDHRGNTYWCDQKHKSELEKNFSDVA